MNVLEHVLAWAGHHRTRICVHANRNSVLHIQHLDSAHWLLWQLTWNPQQQPRLGYSTMNTTVHSP